MITKQNPIVSVLLPVYNGAAYLRTALESVLKQSFSDFELLLIDDCSNDDSLAIAKSYADPRIKIIAKATHKGLIDSLNQGLTLATGKYIARMDADDICLPQRFEKQVAFMDKHPEVGLCGTAIQYLGKTATLQYPTSHGQVLSAIFFNQAIFCHPSVFLRRAVLQKHSLKYPTRYIHSEDYALWLELSQHCQLANLPEALLLYRSHTSQVSQVHRNIQQHWHNHNLRKVIRAHASQISDQTLELHLCLFSPSCDQLLNYSLKEIHQWLVGLYQNSWEHPFLNDAIARVSVANKWWHVCQLFTHQGSSTLRLFFASPIRKHISVGLKNIGAFVVNCMLKRKSSYLSKTEHKHA